MFSRSESTKTALRLIADYNKAKEGKDESAKNVVMARFRRALQDNPSSLMTGSTYDDGDGDVLLRALCHKRKFRQAEILETLAELCPECLVDNSDNTACTPLDLVFEYATKGEMMRIFYRHRNGYGLASRVDDVPLEWIEELIRARPHTLREPDRNGRLPLHDAVDQGSAGYFETILTAWPDAASKPDHEGNLPLHLAASVWKTELSRMLIGCFPGALRVKNKLGLIPLEMALDREMLCMQLDLLSLLVEKDPGVLQRVGEGGLLPSDRAIRNSSSRNLIDFFMKENPCALEPHGPKNQTALHVACQHRPLFVWRIFEYYPEAAMCRDTDGNLPVFYLAGNKRASITSIFLLVAQSMDIFHGLEKQAVEHERS